MIQFKLVKRNTQKECNTISFVNVPSTKLADVNLSTLLEIINKSTGNKSNRDYLPYNKSILTRIMFEQIKRQNILVISHFSKTALNKFLKTPPSSGHGPAKGMFNTLMKLGFDKSGAMRNVKIHCQEA